MKLILALLFLSLISCKFQITHQTEDVIKSQKAKSLYGKAMKELYKGSKGFQKAIDLLNIADKIEPKNAIIIHERGLIKIESKIDVENGFQDLKKSIEYSKDSYDKMYRYCNRGLKYMDIGKMNYACDDWRKSGYLGAEYTKRYCK